MIHEKLKKSISKTWYFHWRMQILKIVLSVTPRTAIAGPAAADP
jgi:hypothetical protein